MNDNTHNKITNNKHNYFFIINKKEVESDEIIRNNIKDKNNNINKAFDKICHICSSSFSGKYEKERHIRLSHKKINVKKCPKCKGNFNNITSHISKCNNNNTYNEFKYEELQLNNFERFSKIEILIPLREEEEVNTKIVCSKKETNFNFASESKKGNNSNPGLVISKPNDIYLERDKDTISSFFIDKINKVNLFNVIKKYSYIKIENYLLFKNLVIGKGKQSIVWFGFDINKMNPIAIKTNIEIDSIAHLETEIEIIKTMQKYQVFTEIYDSLFFNKRLYLLETLHNPNLSKFKKFCGGKFSKLTVYKIGAELLYCLKVLHKSGYIYHDLKCDNISILNKPISVNNNFIHLVLIDYGSSSKYVSDDGSHLSENASSKRRGNVYCSSINSLCGKAVSRRDDVLSLIYLLCDLYFGSLPWETIKKSKNTNKTIIKLKTNFFNKIISDKQIAELMYIFKAASKLSFYEEPDYDGYISLLNNTINQETKNNPSDVLFDWEKQILSFKNNFNKSLNIAEMRKHLCDLFSGYPQYFWKIFVSDY